ncbi:MAG: hypothetical protein WDN28_16515 [Chthoniobacter sp.]
MKILFDQGTPVPFRKALVLHAVKTAYEMGWDNLANGELLNAAEADHFDVLVTTDKNLRYQQNLAGRKVAIFVLPFTSWPRLLSHVPSLVQAINGLASGDFVEWTVP